MKEFLGTGVALVTPFKNDKSIDYCALEKLVNYQIENGVNYIVVLGTTGEPATLTVAEKEQVKNTIIKVNNGRLPLVLGIGGNNTQAIINEINSTDLSAFSAILSVSPYYNKPTQEGIYQHFKTISEKSPKPIIVYNVPGRTASNILPKTILRLATNCNNIIGVKEAAGDIVQAMTLLQNKPSEFLVISGDDMIALPMVLAGGAGVISVIGQGFPKEFSQLIELGIKGKVNEAYELHYKLMDIINYIFEEGNPSGIKALLEKLNITTKKVRLPLVEVSQKLQQKIVNFVENY
jgi:4-hydroxy-tetrahydrodipicolinate synthase